MTIGQYNVFRIVFIVVAIITSGCAAKSRTTDGQLGVAYACTEFTPQFERVEIATIPSMAKIGYGFSQCFVKGTRIDLSIASVKVFKNNLGAGSVRVVFTQRDKIRFVQIAVQNKNRELVFVNKKGAIFSGTIRDPQPQNGLLINGSDLSDAEITANAIIGK